MGDTMKRKLAVILAAILMTSVLASCGNKDVEDTKSNVSSAITVQTKDTPSSASSVTSSKNTSSKNESSENTSSRNSSSETTSSKKAVVSKIADTSSKSSSSNASSQAVTSVIQTQSPQNTTTQNENSNNTVTNPRTTSSTASSESTSSKTSSVSSKDENTVSIHEHEWVEHKSVKTTKIKTNDAWDEIVYDTEPIYEDTEVDTEVDVEYYYCKECFNANHEGSDIHDHEDNLDDCILPKSASLEEYESWIKKHSELHNSDNWLGETILKRIQKETVKKEVGTKEVPRTVHHDAVYKEIKEEYVDYEYCPECGAKK